MLMKIILVLGGLGLASAQERAPLRFGIVKEGAPAGEPALVQAQGVAGTPTVASNTTTTSVPSNSEPCAIVSSSLAALAPSARRLVPAQVGLACLKSVPVDTQGDIQLIKELKLYAQWQSNLAYLKNPPADYTESPVDLMGELDSVSRQLSAGSYQNEYDVQSDLMQLFNRAYDNHLFWDADIISGVMQFQRQPGTELVSVSTDGKELPSIYVYNDILRTAGNNTYKPSPVRTINGEGVEAYLANVALQADFHDEDTRYNALFPNQASLSMGQTFLGAFRVGVFDGPNTTLVFQNGSSRTDQNVAVVFNNFDGVTDGKSFFQKFCTGPTGTQTVAAAAATGSSTTSLAGTTTAAGTPSGAAVTQTGYPSPVIIHPQLAVAGYYLQGQQFSDVAVLSMPTFVSPDVNLWQSIVRQFISMSTAAGKTKLILDMRANGGGNAILGYETFKQVFPQSDQLPYGATQFRAQEVLNIAGQMTSDFNQNQSLRQSDPTFYNDVLGINAGFNFEHNLNVDNQRFNSWDEMFGPQQRNNDSFSSLIRYDFRDPLSTTYAGFTLTGFSNTTNGSLSQPFQSQNMVMLHDGMCSSTCAIAAELLKNQGGVRTVVMGGLPRKQPMQGVAGTKGAQSFRLDDIQGRMQIIYQMGTPQQQATWNASAFGETVFASQIFTRADYPDQRAAGGVNLKDNTRQGDQTVTPLEFIHEAADCKLFYTAAMVNDVTNVWKGAADAMFNGQGCVEGSEGDPTSISGGGQNNQGNAVTMKGELNSGVKMSREANIKNLMLGSLLTVAAILII